MNNLPELTGSEKQIAWAEKLRPAMIEFIDAQLAMLPTWGEADRIAVDLGIAPEAVRETIKTDLLELRQNADAGFWIDWRNIFRSRFSLMASACKKL